MGFSFYILERRNNMEIVEFIEIACECQLTNAEKEFVRSVERHYKKHSRLCYIMPRSSDGLLELYFLWAVMVAFYEPKRKYKCINHEKKPPLGIMPRSYWDGRRQHDITDAIKRYLQVGKKIPEEWIEEYNELTDRYGNVSKTETLGASCTLKNEECSCDCTREYSKKEEDTADE